MEKEKLEKVVTQIYEAGYYNGKMGRDKDNFNINKAIKEIETALNITSGSKRAQKIDWCRICSCEPDQCVFKSRV